MQALLAALLIRLVRAALLVFFMIAAKKIALFPVLSIFLLLPGLSSGEVQFMKSPSSVRTSGGSTAVFENMNFRFSSGKDPASFHFASRSVQQHGAGLFPQVSDSILDFAYFRFKAETIRSVLHLGRFQLNEGIAAAWIEGLHTRTDIGDTMKLTLFSGRPVGSHAVDLMGGMFSRSLSDRYTVGLSYLKESGPEELFREEAGIDVRAQPHRKFALSGRSRVNLETDRWMNHSYSARFGPFRKFTFFAHASLVDYGAFAGSFHGSELTVGGRVAYPISKRLIVGLDARESDGPAGENASQGLRISYAAPGNWSAALFMHRRQGDNAGMDHVQIRADVAKTIGKLTASLNLETTSRNGHFFAEKNPHSEILRIAWELSPAYTLAADLQLAQNAFSEKVRGFLKLEYRFRI